jgi:hypothetical protein
MTQETTQNTTVIIKNLELNWVKLDKPVDNYSGDKLIYDIQVSVPEARQDELEAIRKVRTKDGKATINLSKNAFLKDGEPAAKVRVVDANKEPLDPKIIGNGSIGNVMLMQRPYEIKHPKTGKVTKSGITSMLLAVQVTKLVKYTPTATNRVDFDSVDDTDVSTSSDNTDGMF